MSGYVTRPARTPDQATNRHDRHDRHRPSLSEGTVRNYLSSAVQKTGARNRTEAVRHAQANGWLRRERELVTPILGGLDTRQIAERLFLSAFRG